MNFLFYIAHNNTSLVLQARAYAQYLNPCRLSWLAKLVKNYDKIPLCDFKLINKAIQGGSGRLEHIIGENPTESPFYKLPQQQQEMVKESFFFFTAWRYSSWSNCVLREYWLIIFSVTSYPSLITFENVLWLSNTYGYSNCWEKVSSYIVVICQIIN